MMKKLTKHIWYGSDTVPDAETGKLVAAPPPIADNDGSKEWHLKGLTRGELYLNDYANDPALFVLGSDGLVKRVGGTGSGGGSGIISVNVDILQGEGIKVDKKLIGEDLNFTISHGNTSDVESTHNESIFLIQNLAFDDFGHVTAVNNVNAAKLFDERYLRKDINDTAHGIISFDKDVKSSIFLDGYDGKGWEINSNGTAWLDAIQVRSDIFVGNKFGSPSFAPGFAGWGHEIDSPTATGTFDNIFVRKNFTAYTITYSQIFGLGGSQIVSDINKIERVETMQDRFRCYIDSMDGLMLMNLRAGDGVRVQMRTGTTSIKYLFGRVINVTSEYFDMAKPLLGGEGEPEAGDFALRWGNDRDQTRQGLIYLTTADQGSPFIAIYDGITSESTEDTLKVQLGNLSSIRTTQGVQLSGYGGYFNGIYVENSTVVLDNGRTVEQQFTVMNGEFSSKIEGVRNDMSLEKGNILRNSSFAIDTYFWESENEIHFINVNGAFLWLGGDFYTEKDKVADIYRDGSKNVLRVKHTSIKQKNEYFNVENNIEEEGTYSFSLYCKVIEPGTLTVGFTGTELFLQQQLAPTENYQKLSHVGTWNGKGDFSISFTGEALIYGVSLFNDELADAVIKLQTKIFQNEEMIKLSATKDYVDKATGAIYVKYDSELTVMADDILARVTRQDFDKVTGQLERDLTSKIEVQAGNITAISTDVNNIQNTIDTAGWINSTQGNALFASKTLENGQKIIDYINQTPGHTTISSNRIDLYGAVTFQMFDPNLTQQFNNKLGEEDVGNLAFKDTISDDDLTQALKDQITSIADKVDYNSLNAYTKKGQITKADLVQALQNELTGKLTGSATISSDAKKIASIIVNGKSLVAGGYIQADYLNVNTINAVVGEISKFKFQNSEISAEDIAGRYVRLNNTGGLFTYEDENHKANFGVYAISSASGYNAMAYIRNTVASETYNDGILIELNATKESRYLICKFSELTSYREAILSVKHFSNDASWAYRTCLKMSHMPHWSNIDTITNNRVERQVMWDETTGMLYYK